MNPVTGLSLGRIAIGAAGIHVFEDLRGQTDAEGRPLVVTMPAVADEIAGAADLVKGKATRRPVAIVRGRGDLVTVIQIDVPQKLSQKARQLLAELQSTFEQEA